MRISTLSTRNFPGLGSGEFDLRAPSGKQPLVVISGAPGSGKTSLLRAIAAAKEGLYPYGPALSLEGLAEGQAAKVSATWEFSPSEVQQFALSKANYDTEALWGSPVIAFPDPELQAILGAYDLRPTSPKMELFHAERTLSPGGAYTHASLLAPLEAGLRLTTDNRKYASLKAHAVELFDAQRGGPLAAMFGRLCKSAELASARRGPLGPEVWLRTRFGLTELQSASATEREAFLFAATFSRGGITSSIVLVDNPERFIPRSFAATFVRELLDLGASNQIIVATALDDLGAELDGAVRIQLRASEHV
ncbi:MAG TPA: hypothetical protein VE093_31375 [Polyangiaceae bacterium]|jgi:hypothetical protein|nr:hypothetical protein [Polyangiaceae bacterium]